MKLTIIVLLAGLALIYAEQQVGVGQVAQCECAVFQDDKPATDAKPLLIRTPTMNVNCSDPKTKEDCKKMCVALASASKDQAPQVLCDAMKTHVDHMKPAVFYKVCDIITWEYTGLTATTAICCHEGAPKKCGGGTSAAPGMQTLTELPASTAKSETTKEAK